MQLSFVAYTVSLLDSVALEEQVTFSGCPMELLFTGGLRVLR